MKNGTFFLEQENFDGLLPILWTGHTGVRRRGSWGAGLACVGRRAGVRGALGWRAWDARQGRWRTRRRRLGRGAGGHAGGRRAGARGAQAGRQQRARHGAGGRAGARQGERARGWAHGARGARPTGSTGAQPVRAGWASWARLGFLCTLTRFFGPVRLGSFLSHQMNTVHCKINFFKKKKKKFIKFK